MNRKQRRAELKQPRMRQTANIAQLFDEACRLQRQNRLEDAARAYKRLLLLKPDHAQANNNLGGILQMQGKRAEASPRFARALELTPQLFDQFSAIVATLVAILPPLADAMRRAKDAWPQRPALDHFFDGGFAAVVSDPLLRTVLQSSPIRDLALERLLTALRAGLIEDAAAPRISGDVLAFGCALAQQCFINEYVFATTDSENDRIEKLKSKLPEVSPAELVLLAMYEPLHALPQATALLARTWPKSVDAVLQQQLREPLQERALQDSIPRLTPIDDPASQRVRQMYEENPYPRWVNVAADPAPLTIDEYLRGMFLSADFASPASTDHTEVLVAGCGTGWHAISFAYKFKGTRLLAIDLSLASLAYAKRKTPSALADRVQYAQADILNLGSLERRFDVIDASGVLHHMADLFAGWRILLALLRPGGVMHVGLYSEIARADVVAARKFIAERGYAPTAQDIRRCRQELLDTPARGVARFHDYFSMSECRDMLFHVQESRTTIPAIKAFIAEQGLRFVGFEFGEPALQHYRRLFADNGWSMTDLDRWHEVETRAPDTFAGMYQLWLQKP